MAIESRAAIFERSAKVLYRYPILVIISMPGVGSAAILHSVIMGLFLTHNATLCKYSLGKELLPRPLFATVFTT
jgi:hypothetical protein